MIDVANATLLAGAHSHDFPAMKRLPSKNGFTSPALPSLPSTGASAKAAPSLSSSTASAGSGRKNHVFEHRDRPPCSAGIGVNKASPMATTAPAAIVGCAVAPQQHSTELAEAMKAALSSVVRLPLETDIPIKVTAAPAEVTRAPKEPQAADSPPIPPPAAPEPPDVKPLVNAAAASTSAANAAVRSKSQQPSPTRQRPERRRHSKSKSRSNSYNEQAASGGGAGGIPPAHGVLNGIVASLKSLSGIQALLIGVMLMAVVIGVTITVLNVVWMAEVGDRLDRALDAVREARIGKAGLEHASIASLIGEKKVHDEERMSLEYDAARKTFRSLSRSQMGSAKAALAEAGRSAELMREKLTYLKTELADAVEYFAAVTTAPKRPAKNETDVNASEDLLSETNNAVEGGQEGASFRRSLTDDDQRKMVAMIMGQLAVAVKSFNDSASSPPVDDNKFNAKAVVAIDED